MKTSAFRRLTLTFLLGIASLIACHSASAQAIAAGSGVVTTNGVTGTDPVPPSCGCGPKTPTQPAPKAVSRS